MPADNANTDDTPPPTEERIVESDDWEVEPAGWTMTEEEIREIMSSGITLQDVMRELKLDGESE